MTAAGPSFAVEATRRIEAGDMAGAVRLCADGIATFPDYATGYIVLARAYEALDMASDASLMRHAAAERFPLLVPLPPPAAAHPEAYTFQEQVSVEEQESYVEDEPHTEASNSEAAEHTSVPPEALEPARPALAAVEETAPDDVVAIPIAANAPTLVQAQPSHHHVRPALRMIDLRQHHATDSRVIRAASVRLIPGLEYTSLRFEGMKSRGRREIATLLDPPPFREFHAPMRPMPRRADDAPATKPATRRLTLEELAQRLERARMPRPDELALRPTPPPPQPTTDTTPASTTGSQPVVTETIARIYESQGAYEKALDAYRALQRAKPERHSHYQDLIDNLTRRLTQ
jgi:tetratricopeptide (TPR) repeat protein